MTDQKAGDYPIDIINEGLAAEITHLRAQRDQLLNALKALLKPLPRSQPTPLPKLVDAITRARAAIAAMEGEN